MGELKAYGFTNRVEIKKRLESSHCCRWKPLRLPFITFDE